MNINSEEKIEILRPRAYSIKDTAVLLSVSTRSVRRLIERGLLNPILVLRKKLIPSREIDRLLGEGDVEVSTVKNKGGARR